MYFNFWPFQVTSWLRIFCLFCFVGGVCLLHFWVSLDTPTASYVTLHIQNTTHVTGALYDGLIPQELMHSTEIEFHLECQYLCCPLPFNVGVNICVNPLWFLSWSKIPCAPLSDNPLFRKELGEECWYILLQSSSWYKQIVWVSNTIIFAYNCANKKKLIPFR